MRRSALLALALGAATAASACDARDVAGASLAALGRPSLREVDAEDGARLVRDGGLVLEARGATGAAPGFPGALAVREGEDLAEPPAGRRFVVVSEDPEQALRLGARLAREGAARVAVVTGGLPAWSAAALRPAVREE